MHEYSIAASLLSLAEEHARKHQATRVTRLELSLGELSGVEVELLESAWTLVRGGSACEGAALAIRRVAARFACERCPGGAPSGGRLLCAACGRPLRLVEGDELLLDRIEMEVA